nr:hypothetical protein [Desulfuromonas thiophila]
MPDRHNPDGIVLDAVEKPIRCNDDLAKVNVWKLRNGPPGFGVVAEQAIYGRVFRSVTDVREAVKTFVELYDSEWRVEKNGFRSPDEIRQAV